MATLFDIYIKIVILSHLNLSHFPNPTSHLTRALTLVYQESYVTGSRFDPDFVEERRRALQTYLERVARHPTLQRSKALKRFLEQDEPLSRSPNSPPPTNSSLPGTSPPTGSAAVLDNLSDTLMNAFSKLRTRDERFAQVGEQIARLEEAMSGVGKAGGKITKAEKDLDHDLAEFALCMLELSKMETGLTGPMSRFAHAVQGTTERLREKETLKLRDQKQLDHQDLSDFYQQTITERDRLLSHRGGAGGGGVAGYIKDQIDAVRGVNPETARQEKLAKLERRAGELQENCEQSLLISRAFSASLTREIDLFQTLKVADFKHMLGDHARAQAKYFRDIQKLWDEIVPELEAYELPTE
ncbi:intercellular trafficking and secretion [Gonapodya sp. JEL0774]|nr:intercellular trafficking and secretion [Gonapodya sp. JEL0774]